MCFGGIYMYEIVMEIGNDWENLGNQYYASRKEAELELLDHWQEMDIQQMDYSMDDYAICEVK